MLSRAAIERHKEGDSYRKRERILVLSLLLFTAVIIVCLIVLRPVHAAENDTGLKISADDLNDITELACEQNEYLKKLTTMFMTTGETESGGPSLLYSLMENVDVGDGTQVKALGNIGREACSCAGAILVFAYAVIEFLQMMQREEESTETILKILVITVVGFILVVYVYDIMKAIENLGNVLFTSITSEVDQLMSANGGVYVPEAAGVAISAEGFDALSEAATEAVDAGDKTVKGASGIAAAGFIGSIMMYVTYYLIITSAYALLFQLVIRKIFAPIAVADCVSEGLRSPGARYLKNYFGTYIQIAIFSVVVALGWAASCWVQNYGKGVFESGSQIGAIGAVYCIRFAMKAIINASGQTVKEIVGG